MNDTANLKPRRGRPRSTKTHDAILKAASNLIAERGVPGVTIEAVAKLSGAGKPTIYRYWANAHELAMAALIQATPTLAPGNDNMAPLDAFRALLHQISETFTHANGRYVASLLASAHEDSDMAKAFRSHFIQKQRQEAEALCRDAVKDGSLSADFNIPISMDLVFGAIFYRLVMTGEAIDRPYMDQLFRTAIKD